MKTFLLLTACFLPIAAEAEDLRDLGPSAEGLAGILTASAVGNQLDFDSRSLAKAWLQALPEEHQRLQDAYRALNDGNNKENSLRQNYFNSAEYKEQTETIAKNQELLKTTELGLKQPGLSAADTKTLHDIRKGAVAAIDEASQRIKAVTDKLDFLAMDGTLGDLVKQRKEELAAAKLNLLKAPTPDVEILRNRVAIKNIIRNSRITKVIIGAGIVVALDGGRRVYYQLTAPAVIEGKNFAPKQGVTGSNPSEAVTTAANESAR